MMIINLFIVNYKTQLHNFTTHKAIKELDEACKQGPEAVKEWQQRYSDFETEKKGTFRLNLRRSKKQ